MRMHSHADPPSVSGSAIVIQGNAACLPLPDNSVDLVVTSPPYFALRSYQDGGQHYAGQIGSEPTPQAFLEALWACTAEWMRVLKPSGSIFVNLGDKYAGQGSFAPVVARRNYCPAEVGCYRDRSAVDTPGFSSDQCPCDSSLSAQSPQYPSQPSPYGENFTPQSRQVASSSSSIGIERGSFKQGARDGNRRSRPAPVPGIPGKSLMLLPERYRIGCVDRLGLIARSVIVWDKPNGLPESVTDRVRRSHEDWVHLTLQPRYFSAIDEIREGYAPGTAARYASGYNRGAASSTGQSANPVLRADGGGPSDTNPLGKLPGSVWTIPSEPLNVPDELGVDHFAAFPTEWPRRVIQGWTEPGMTVLDPFGGTGTTALCASVLGRIGISVDLSHDYSRLAQWRTTDPGQRAKAMRVEKPPVELVGQIDMFGGAA